MQFTTVFLALAAASAASAQGVSALISPTGAPPAGCTGTYNGNFEITIVKPAAKREVQKRAACGGVGTLVINLQNGVMHDAQGRQGYIASNYQFQFDPNVPQAGAIYTSGFSVCPNSSVALGPSAVFYQCLSGGFYNLYNKDWAAQCEPVAIDVVPCGGSSLPAPAGGSSAVPPPASGSAAPAPATEAADGQPQATSATMIPVSEFTDGQPQVVTAVVSQISDGQIQNPTAAPAPTVAVAGGAVVEVAQKVILAAAGLAGMALL